MSIIYMKVRLHKQEVASRRWENPEFQRIINGYQWQYTGYTWDAGYRCWVHLIVGQTDILGFGVEHSPGSQLSGLTLPLDATCLVGKGKHIQTSSNASTTKIHSGQLPWQGPALWTLKTSPSRLSLLQAEPVGWQTFSLNPSWSSYWNPRPPRLDLEGDPGDLYQW